MAKKTLVAGISDSGWNLEFAENSLQGAQRVFQSSLVRVFQAADHVDERSQGLVLHISAKRFTSRSDLQSNQATIVGIGLADKEVVLLEHINQCSGGPRRDHHDLRQRTGGRNAIAHQIEGRDL